MSTPQNGHEDSDVATKRWQPEQDTKTIPSHSHAGPELSRLPCFSHQLVIVFSLRHSVAMAHESHDPLEPQVRTSLLKQKRPKPALPIHTGRQHRKLPILPTRPIDAQQIPIYAVWEVTLACNLACRHCGSRAGKARPDELSTDECLDLIKQMAELGVKEVSMIGGEAYLRPDWLTLIESIRDHGMKTNMTTGGRGITAQMARDAKSAGLEAVSVSIDGSEEVHDRLRAAKGSYKAAVQSMKHMVDAGVRLSTNTQINRLSLPTIHEVLDLMIDVGSKAWQIQLTVAMGRAADEPEVLLQPYDLVELFPILGDLKDRCDEAGIRMWPGNNIGYFGPLEAKLRGAAPRGEMASCTAGRYVLGIEADGAIKGCPSLPTKEWVGGTVREHSLREIWEGTEPLRYTRDRTVDDLWGFCRDCYYADVCKAGCTWTSTVLFGKPGNNPYCHHRALEMKQQGKRERVVRSEDAPNLPFDAGKFELVVEDWPSS